MLACISGSLGEGVFMEAKGVGGQLELLEDKVLIKRKGLAAKGMGGDREIPLRQVASIELKEPGKMSLGYIQFVLGGQEPVTSFWKVSSDPNTVEFNYRQKESFEALKQAVEQRIAERQEPAEVLVKTPAEMLVKT